MMVRFPARPRARLVVVAGAATLALTSLVALPAAASSQGRGHHGGLPDNSSVVSWNATAVAAVVTDAGQGAPTAVPAVAYVQAAVYNAVVGIEGGYQQYAGNQPGPRGASVEAAVAAAARGVLLHYFPVSQPRVDAAYAAALDAIPDGWRKDAGVQYGEQAAAALVAARASDGWFGSTTFTKVAAPGIWRPTPPAFVPFATAWLGEMTPFLLKAHDQFRPCGPPALTSARYAADLNEVKSVGSATSTTRTAHQTDVALFFGLNNYAVLTNGAFRDHITRHGLDIVQAARYLAVADLAAADGVITAWDSKYHFGNWRPITAIQLADTDGDPATDPDSMWTPLVVTPPFPDYLSGHTTVTGAFTRALTLLGHSDHIDLTMTAPATGETMHWDTAAELNADSIGARIWAGIHFRTADAVGNAVGKRVGAWDFRHGLQRLDD
jgi:hypothetical protein